ncbi:MAG: esterase/lipase family protein [Candidatus Woesearchaeota archaeon]
MDKKAKKILKYTIFLIISIILIIFIFRLYLYLRFLVGYNILIKIEAPDNLGYIPNGDTISLNFTTSITANPFCEVSCVFNLEDVSNDRYISVDTFIGRPKTFNFNYNVTVPEYGSGIVLYRYNVECKSKQTFLCQAEGNNSRKALVPIRHKLTEYQEQIRNVARIRLNDALFKIDMIQQIENNTNINLNSNGLKQNLSKYLEYWQNSMYEKSALVNKTDIDNAFVIARDHYEKIRFNTTVENALIEEINRLYIELQYIIKFDEIITRHININQITLNENTLINTTEDNNLDINNNSNNHFDNSTNYNLTNINNSQEINQSSELNLSNGLNISKYNYSSFIHNMINRFNYIIEDKEDLIEISTEIINMSNEIKDLFNKLNYYIINKSIDCNECDICLINALNNSLDEECYSDNISKPNFNKIILASIDIDRNVSLDNNSDRCCIRNECMDCLEDPKMNYPVIFLHGHAFNERTSAEVSLDGFSIIQRKLEQESNIIDGGAFTLYTRNPIGIQEIPARFSFKVSYYYDALYQPDDIILIQTKSENLDTYTIRLHEIIQNIKQVTGKNKVSIVAHSMGGLIVRRYMQLFGEDDIDSVVFIAVPNRGVKGTIATLCRFKGSNKECNDMQSNSVFINKIERYNHKVTIHNIIATGCVMEERIGDGIVFRENQYLENANNIYISGNCDGINFLHNRILDVRRYPEVLNIIIESITNK